MGIKGRSNELAITKNNARTFLIKVLKIIAVFGFVVYQNTLKNSFKLTASNIIL